MGINSTEVSYGFGQLGSVFTDSANNPITPPIGKVFVAITFLADTQLEITSGTGEGLTADTSNTASAGLEYVGTAVAAHNLSVGSETTTSGGGGQIIDNANTFPAGVTIYGRWTNIEIGNGKSGALIAYIGD
jgi:hypothetical protein